MTDQTQPVARLTNNPPITQTKPIAVIKAYRKTGNAIAIIERRDAPRHRHQISLRRYARLREWTIAQAPRRWRTSGAWLRGSITVCLWSTG